MRSQDLADKSVPSKATSSQPVINWEKLPKIAELKGALDDCCCSAEKVDKYNNGPIFEILSNLTRTEFFQYFRVNYVKPCPFWAQNYLCSMTEGGGCGVCECTEQEVPKPWIEEEKGKKSPPTSVDTTISNKAMLERRKGKNGSDKDVWCDCADDEEGKRFRVNRLILFSDDLNQAWSILTC